MFPIPPPTGPVAILFIDLVFSSSLWTSHPASMKSYRRHFYTFIRTLTATHSGYEIKSLGDGFLLIFSSPLSALHFSLKAQKRLPPFPIKGVNVEVRIGINWGVPDDAEIDEVSGRWDIWGQAVDITKRIEGVAEGGGLAVSWEFMLELLCWVAENHGGFGGGCDDHVEIQERVLGMAAPGWGLEVRDFREKELKGCGKVGITLISLK